MTQQELLSIAEEACSVASNAGADFAEVRVSEGRSTSVRLERSAIDTTQISFSSGAGIRVYINGGLGSVSLDGLDLDRLKLAAQQAVDLARLATPDKDFVSLPEPQDGSSVPGLYDPGIENLGVSDMARIALECVDAARSVAPEAICTGSAGCGSGRSAIANSLGVARSSESSSISAWIEPIVKRNGDVGAFYDFDSARLLADFDHTGIGMSAAQTAVQFLGARKIESGVMPVILGPLSSGSVFGALAAGAEAESHQRGRSWLLGKLGRKVAADILTVRDDATIPAGLSSRSHDSEGVPTRPITIVENGVLINFLHNSYTAHKAKANLTGHARGGGIGPTNVNVELGEASAAQIIRDTKRGLYINMGRLSPDSTTGEVSAMVDFGFMIENGEIAYPVAGVMAGINGLEMMANIDAISSDGRVEPGSVSPTIRIQNIRIAGGK
ncbi:MAG: TldD/PmbA family protein [Armatimonadetes bacterium]|nr:TldD/PmbA family protein [Armatimonadota bacterium]